MKSAPSLLKVKPKIIKDLHYVENKYYNNYIFLKAKLQLFKKLALFPVSDLTICNHGLICPDTLVGDYNKVYIYNLTFSQKRQKYSYKLPCITNRLYLEDNYS